MIKQVHIFLCWILAVSLFWLPLTVSASISLSQAAESPCHEMSSSSQMPNMAHSGMAERSMTESMDTKNCCDNDCQHCKQSCKHCLNDVFSGVLYTPRFMQTASYVQFQADQFVQYFSFYSPPDLQPPVV